jgi:hypothetical protein
MARKSKGWGQKRGYKAGVKPVAQMKAPSGGAGAGVRKAAKAAPRATRAG